MSLSLCLQMGKRPASWMPMSRSMCPTGRSTSSRERPSKRLTTVLRSTGSSGAVICSISKAMRKCVLPDFSMTGM